MDADYIDPDGRDMGQWVDDPTPDPETDPERPPRGSTPVICRKCGKQYSSSDMRWWVDEDCPEDAFQMFGWLCANKDCDGYGFGADIRPTDPNFVDPDGRSILRPGEERVPPPFGSDDDAAF